MHDDANTLGQLFMVGIPDPMIDSTTRAQLLDLRPGGVILFRRNYTDLKQLAALCEELHALLPHQPPLIALDHEGGRVHRLTAPFTHFPAATVVGRTQSVELAQRVGKAMGEELSSIGVDIDFAPVLDVLTNTANTVIGARAFAADPQTVGLFGCAQARGLRAGGVIPCGKHFPGHGATQVDSHEDLPRDERSLDALKQTDCQPFRMAIAEGIEMLMTAHILYPALDAEYPATLSQKTIEGLLRQQLGYQGVVVTDDLEMGAIVRRGAVEQAAVQALCAGADLLLICHKIDFALAAREACLQALAEGILSSQRLEEARRRLAFLRRQHAQHRRASRVVIGSPEHQQLVEIIMQRASEKV
ncbi:MAG: beta-N-acetylhexosaminidase [Candidatus Binatia bacterium]